MVYFLSTIDPSLTRSGLEKRCHMWWHYWKKEKEAVQWIQLPEQWCQGSRINRLLLKLIPFEALPRPVQLFLFFSGSPIRQLYKHNRRLSRILSQRLQPDDVIFVFRAYNTHYLQDNSIRKLIGRSEQLIIDFDESDYLSLSTFDQKPAHWAVVKGYIQQREQFLLSLKSVTYYVSGENESLKMHAHYRPAGQIRVMNNKLAIKPVLHQKLLSTPLQLILIGTYSYEPNLEMVKDLIHIIIPSLAAPRSYQFHIVGHGLPDELAKKLKANACVTVHGGLSDAELIELFKTIHLNLTLVRSGGGTKYKLVEALAYGIPIVATTASAEGLSIEPMKHYIPVTSHTFEESLRMLNQELYSTMQLECRSAYDQHYRFDSVDY